MTRAEIEKDYKTRDGIIISLGKFEGEPVWAPFFYDLWTRGEEDHELFYDNVYTTVFDIDSSDVERFPELFGVKRIHLWENNEGFVSTRVIR